MAGKRRRITIINSQLNDPDEYKQNSCSANAKQIELFSETVDIELWIDKHYSVRNQFGDDDGPREGIGEEYTKSLIKKSFRHLMYYSSKHKDFLFVNHPPKKNRNIRIVLIDKFSNATPLNVVAEYHFVKLNIYEVTIKTAMRKDEFDLSDGQYAIAFEEDYSILYKDQKRDTIRIDDYSE